MGLWITNLGTHLQVCWCFLWAQWLIFGASWVASWYQRFPTIVVMNAGTFWKAIFFALYLHQSPSASKPPFSAFGCLFESSSMLTLIAKDSQDMNTFTSHFARYTLLVLPKYSGPLHCTNSTRSWKHSPENLVYINMTASDSVADLLASSRLWIPRSTTSTEEWRQKKTIYRWFELCDRAGYPTATIRRWVHGGHKGMEM